ncbi:ABC transporter ATP-binding protein [Gryllotalpicola protaetiae]|uniref:ABC transporter ATP-binding protein n=1 Tax=Gryllotalpicola protaetiae TaxID=2419771 RepID=A0A387C3Q8_9MICO|nr:ABC transporter ATP-binding protein [Gryllotalpicola protaetiae]
MAEGLTIEGPVGTIVQPLSFAVAAGRSLAIVGESGSGKTMVAKALVGLLPNGVSSSGSLRHAGTAALLPQDPFTSLSPVHRCGEQIAWTVRAAARRAGRRAPGRRELAAAVTRLLDEVNLAASVSEKYPHELSGGMRQRVSIAAAIAADPQLLIADEPTTALDASNRLEILELVRRVQRERGLAALLISHDLGLVRGFADDVLVLYAGRVVEAGQAAAVLGSPVHPYTAALSQADPPIDVRLVRLGGLEGSVPKPGEPHSGCIFYARCALRQERCLEAEPALEPRTNASAAACFVSDGPLPLARPERAAESAVATASALLEVAGVTRSFGRHLALAPADLTVAPGEAVGVAGESGSGKTTLARCIAGLEAPDAGTIRFEGVQLTPRNRTPGGIQVVFQDPYSALNPALSIGGALAEAMRSAPASARRSVAELLAMVGLPADYARRRPRELSGGERQRVVIARALAPNPRLLICDESVSALDVSVQAQILELLRSLQRELDLSLIFISHDLAVLRQVSDRLYVMRHGQIIEQGPTAAVIDSPSHAYTQQLVAASTESSTA